MLLILACLLVFGAVVSLVMGLATPRGNPMESRVAALRGERPATYQLGARQESINSRVLGPLANSLGSKLEQLLPSRWLDGIRHQLISAGEPTTLSGFLAISGLVVGAMLLFALTILTAGNAGGKEALFLGIGSPVVGFMLPKVWLSNRVRARQKAIIRSLPDAFDLITTCVEAGLGLDAGLAKVAEKAEGPFGEELSLMLREVSLGRLRRDALKDLADRCDIPDLSTFINAVIQAESMGTSIASVLRVQADQMRIKRRQRAEQQAQQAPVKMVFPLVLFIFPTLFVVILGPAALTIYDQLVKG